jgi:hypothetical protein
LLALGTTLFGFLFALALLLGSSSGFPVVLC